MSNQLPAHILLLNSRSEYGGADMALLNMVRYLDPQRFRATVVLPHPGPLVEHLQAAGAHVEYMDICRLERFSGLPALLTFLSRFFSSMRQLRRIIRDQNVDLVYTNSSAIPVGALAARLAGIPNIWHIREIWISPAWLTRPLYRYAYSLADSIVVISQAVSQSCFGRRQHKIVLIRDSVDPERFLAAESDPAALRAAYRLTQPWPVITTVARLVPGKGLHVLVEAACRLRDQGIDAYVLIAGDIPRERYRAYREQLEAQIRDNGLSDRVQLLGWITDAPALISSSDLFVLPSVHPEGGGTVILEGWMAGLPVLVPDSGGPVEIVEHGRTGLIFRTGDPDDLAEKIAILLNDADAATRMAEAGRAVTMANHHARDLTRRVEQEMSRLIGR